MPVINGVYTKDFPALGRAPIDTDIIPIAEVANQITYKTTIGAIFNAKVFGTTGRLSKFTTANTLGNSILNEIGNAIHLTNSGSSYASFGIINPGTPGDPGVDNDGYIGSTINNDFTIRVNNVEAARFDTAYRFKITTIQNATTDTDKFLVSDGGIVKYRTGTELRSDIGAGVGSVTSVGLTMPVAFSVANSPITSSGSLDVTAVGTASQYIRGDGQLATLPTGGGGGSAVNYYLNGSIAASVATYKQMSNSAVIGGGTDFNLVGNGLISQFLTDVGNPNRLLIPGGAWNFEMFFSVSSVGGNQKFYIELLKYDGTTFSLIASSSTNPEEITGGTTTDLYLTSLAVPETVLLTTDRLAVRVYIVDNSGGRTVTLHTEDNNLCLVTTTFAGGISALNGLTANTQYFAVGTSGTDFNISSLTDTHTFNLPTASATNRGALSSANWSTFNAKQDTITLTTTGSSGAATFIANTLNIPNYGSALSNYVTLNTDQTIGGFKSFSNSVSLLNGTSNALNFEIGTSGNFAGLKAPSSGGSVIITLPSATGTLALTSALTGYVPYLGATGAVNLGAFDLTVNTLTVGRGTGNISTNTAIGVSALSSNTTGGSNTASGYTALLSNTTGYNNTASGSLALFSNTTGSYNTATGYTALQNNTTGSNNTSLGYAAGSLISSGVSTNQTSNNSVYLGYDTRASANGNTNEIVIGYDGRGGGSNSATLGNSSIATTILHGNTSIGYTTNPSLYKLDVNGVIRGTGNAYFGGNVGIGTTTPGVRFVNSGAANTTSPTLGSGTVGSNAILSLNGLYGLYTGVSNTGDVWQQVQRNDGTTTAYNLLLQPSGGNVGIGTPTPTYQLQLSTDSAAKPTSALWTIASDVRIKENITPYIKGLADLLKINPINYDYNGLGGFKKGKGGVGIIAQEIMDILPDSVNSVKGKLNETDKEEIDILNFNGHELTYVLINAIKEQQAQIEELKLLIQNK